MDKSNLKLCVICCSAFSSAGTVPSDAVLCREHLLTFCKLLANSPPKHSPQFDLLLQKSFPGMDAFFQESDMSVCADCNHQITVAMEKGAEAEKKEEEVRRLQLQILTQMRELQKQVDSFHEEMTKVEKVIQTSDVSCLMYHMAKNPSKNEDATNGIVLIRDRILDVMADLRDFQSRQNNLLNFDVEKWLRKVSESQGLPPPSESDASSFTPFIPEPDAIIGTEGLLEAVGLAAPMFFGHTIFTNEGDFRYEANGGGGGGAGGDSDFTASEAEVSDDDDSDVLMELPVQTIIETPPAPPKKGAPPKRLPPNVIDIESSMNSASNDLFPGPPSFKREIVERALERQRNRTFDDEASLDPLIRHPIKYDPSTGKLTVNTDFEIIVNEKDRTLKCATCGLVRRENKRGGGSLDLEWRLRVHIIAGHVGFKCTAPGCKVQSPDHQQFLKHLKLVHGHGVKIVNNNQRHHQNPVPVPRRTPQVGIRSSPRGTGGGPPPPPPARSSSSANNKKGQRSNHSNNSGGSVLRTCPVSACRQTFTKKEGFIRHLQGHRNQTKLQRSKVTTATPSSTSNDDEPELVILD